jgi:predicted branched-subunit amino acid permease
MPDYMLSALSVAIYGMFLAVIIPPAKHDKRVLITVICAMLLSSLFYVAPVLRSISSGFSIIIITIVVAGAAAFIAPIEEEDSHA